MNKEEQEHLDRIKEQNANRDKQIKYLYRRLREQTRKLTNIRKLLKEYPMAQYIGSNIVNYKLDEQAKWRYRLEKELE